MRNYRINLFEIAWLTPEQVNLFRSDFKVVADYFVQMRMNKDYKPSREELDHIQAVLQLMNVMDHERRFEAKQNEQMDEFGEVNTVSEWLDRVIRESEERGRKQEAERADKEAEKAAKEAEKAAKEAEKAAKEAKRADEEAERANKAEDRTIRTLWNLVSKNRMTIDEAAEGAELTVEEFRARGTALMMAEPTAVYQAGKQDL